jgi:hypothetical protein
METLETLEILDAQVVVEGGEVLPPLTSVCPQGDHLHITSLMEMLDNRGPPLQVQEEVVRLVELALPDKMVLVELKEILEQRGKLIPHLMETQDSLILETLEMLGQQDKHQLHLELLFLVASVVMVELETRELPAMVELEIQQLRDLLEILDLVEVKVAAAEGEVPVWDLLLLVVLVVLVGLVVVLLEMREGMDRSVPEQHTQLMFQLLGGREVLVPLQVVLVEVLQVIDLLRPH